MADKDLVVRALRELVDALDRRVAHVERLGEAQIAREAAGLRRLLGELGQDLARSTRIEDSTS